MREEIVSTKWLKSTLTDANLVILDASPKSSVTGKTSSFSDLCIPHARVFDVRNKFTNKESNFPNTFPSAAQFERECQALGINNNSEIVVYDNLGIYTSTRVWWLFKTMGHDTIKVLNGGLPDWISQVFETVNKTDLSQEYSTGDFKAYLKDKYILTYNDILDNQESKNFLLVDARSRGRFEGTAPEPRKHLKSGSIPGSTNIPYTTLLKDGKFKSNVELQNIFDQIDSQKELAFSCGSGMTACIVLLAYQIATGKRGLLYDGSWTEYAELQNLKVST